jgi:hypothetical protein
LVTSILLHVMCSVADKMEACRLCGPFGEQLKLVSSVRPQQKATKWLSLLENCIKTTVQIELEACVRSHLEDGKGRPLSIF